MRDESAEFEIKVADLSNGSRDYTGKIRREWLRGALEETDISVADEDGNVRYSAQKLGSDVLIDFDAQMVLRAPCARCLKDADVPVRARLKALFVPEKSRKLEVDMTEDGTEVSSTDAELYGYDGEVVIIDNLVRDELLLELPMTPLCSDACPGITPPPEEESEAAAIDPRLQPLLRFKKLNS